MSNAANIDADANGRRVESRATVSRTAILRVRGAEPAKVLLADITCNGSRIVTDRELAPGDAVIVGIAGVGPVAGRIVWHGAQGYGCRFDAELPAGACAAAGRENVVRIGVNGLNMPFRSEWAVKDLSAWRIATLAACCVLPWLGIGVAVLLR